MTIYDMDQLRQQRELREEAEREMLEGRQKMTSLQYQVAGQIIHDKWLVCRDEMDRLTKEMEDLRDDYLGVVK